MYALKEKVSEKLSRLLADSPSPPSPQLQESPKVNSYSMGAKTLSSFLTYIHPSATKQKTQGDLKSSQSSPTRWKSSSFSRRIQNMENQAELIPQDECRESTIPHNEHESPASTRSNCVPEFFEDAIEPPSPWKLMPNLTDDSSYVDGGLYEFLEASLPNIVKGCQWVLLYSTLKHGTSLRTLIRKSADLPGPGLLIVGDRKGAVFGGLLDCPLKPCPRRKYQGTNHSFVFTTKYGEPRLFRATGANRYFYLCLNDFLAFGGGGNFALSLDEDLLAGSSGPCQTFGNSCLAHDPEFELKNVELWGFIHSSRYLT
ncbi:oxidation resistance protein 1-like [Chenopodium quinoa]|uniref:oxidation resistance protein 1-like n=1 Tax=Chenopodium quinoa TaxID=63459 RepID=UPI000B77F558|nr:oxidation resistance protein 1-like [Chenopodium quinoa]